MAGGERGADTHAPRFARGHVGPWGPYAPRGKAMRCRPSTWVELWGSLPRGRRRALLLVLAACVTSPSSRAPAGPGGLLYKPWQKPLPRVCRQIRAAAAVSVPEKDSSERNDCDRERAELRRLTLAVSSDGERPRARGLLDRVIGRLQTRWRLLSDREDTPRARTPLTGESGQGPSHVHPVEMPISRTRGGVLDHASLEHLISAHRPSE
jgi:hypothetical protein